MEKTADLLRGIAALVWPTALLVALLLFRNEIGGLLQRLRKAKVLGQEVELDRSLDQLEERVERLARVAGPSHPSEDRDAAGRDENGPDQDSVTAILREAARSPKVALMSLAAELEKEIRRLLAAIGAAGDLTADLRDLAEALSRRVNLPYGTADAYRQFMDVRNQIIHGEHPVRDDEILRALDSGLSLLKIIQAVPRERNVVFHPGVPIYGDPDCTDQLPGVGVVLETQSPGGVVISHRVYPTTRSHFVKGRAVAWEWSDEHRWGRAWYRDPDTGEIHHAWDGSMEFVGRLLDEI